MRVLILFFAFCALSEAFLFKWLGQKGGAGAGGANNRGGGAVDGAVSETPVQQLYFQVPESLYYLNNVAGQPLNFLNVVEPRHPVVQHPIPGAPVVGTSGSSAFGFSKPAIQIVGAPQAGLPFYAPFGNNGHTNEQSTIQAPYPLAVLLQSPASPTIGSAVHVGSAVGNQALPIVVADHLSPPGQSLQQFNLGGNSGSFNVQQTLPANYQAPLFLQSPVSFSVANQAYSAPILNGQVVADHRFPSSQSLQQVSLAGSSDIPVSHQFVSQDNSENVEQEHVSTTTKPFEFPSNQQPPYTSQATFNGVSLDPPISLPSFNIDNSFASLPSSYGPPLLPAVQNEQVSQHSYTLGDGTQVSEQTSVVSSADGVKKELVKSGEYEYISENGSLTKVKWVADDNGFRVLP